MNEQRTVIHKHYVGLVAILLGGFVAAMLVTYGALLLQSGGALNSLGVALFLVVACLAFGFSIIQAITYWRSTVVMDANGVTFTNWYGFFFSVQSQADWTDLQDVSYQKGGILALFFDYGSVTVHTASGRANLTMTMLPEPEALAGFIDQHIN